MQTLITSADRISAVAAAAMFAGTIFGTATLLHHAISRRSERKRIQGGPVRWWAAGLWMVGSVIGAIFADNQRYYLHEVVYGLGGFGLLVGLVIGNLHGWIRLPGKSKPKVESDDGDHETQAPASNPAFRHDPNPYASPRSK